MAYIKRLTDKPRKMPWRAQIRRKGHKVIVKMFASKSEAEHWASEQERAIRLTGLPHTNKELEKHLFREIIIRYRDEITPAKGCRISEATVLNKLLRHPISSLSLAYINRQDAYKYLNDRLKETWKGKPIKPSTVRREINTIQHIFEVAREQWGFTNLQNPFRGMKIKGSMNRRKRRLQVGELTRIEQACKECRGLNRYYVPLAVHLAIETGMRLQEIFNLERRDFDLENRRIDVRKSKTDHVTQYTGRTIVLTVGARWYYTRLLFLGEHTPAIISEERKGKLLPMRPDAFKQSWKDVLKRAGIKDLTFHDLRREAGSRFDEADLTKPQHDLMMGHSSNDMQGLYAHSRLKSIQDKLDRYVLGGLTLGEFVKRCQSERAVYRIEYTKEEEKRIPVDASEVDGGWNDDLIFLGREGEKLDGSLIPEEPSPIDLTIGLS